MFDVCIKYCNAAKRQYVRKKQWHSSKDVNPKESPNKQEFRTPRRNRQTARKVKRHECQHRRYEVDEQKISPLTYRAVRSSSKNAIFMVYAERRQYPGGIDV